MFDSRYEKEIDRMKDAGYVKEEYKYFDNPKVPTLNFTPQTRVYSSRNFWHGRR